MSDSARILAWNYIHFLVAHKPKTLAKKRLFPAIIQQVQSCLIKCSAAFTEVRLAFEISIFRLLPASAHSALSFIHAQRSLLQADAEDAATGSTPDRDEDSDEHHLYLFMANILDIIAQKIPPALVLPPVSEFVSNNVAHAESGRRKAAQDAMGAIVEGCANYIRTSGQSAPRPRFEKLDKDS